MICPECAFVADDAARSCPRCGTALASGVDPWEEEEPKARKSRPAVPKRSVPVTGEVVGLTRTGEVRRNLVPTRKKAEEPTQPPTAPTRPAATLQPAETAKGPKPAGKMEAEYSSPWSQRQGGALSKLLQLPQTPAPGSELSARAGIRVPVPKGRMEGDTLTEQVPIDSLLSTVRAKGAEITNWPEIADLSPLEVRTEDELVPIRAHSPEHEITQRGESADTKLRGSSATSTLVEEVPDDLFKDLSLAPATGPTSPVSMPAKGFSAPRSQVPPPSSASDFDLAGLDTIVPDGGVRARPPPSFSEERFADAETLLPIQPLRDALETETLNESASLSPPLAAERGLEETRRQIAAREEGRTKEAEPAEGLVREDREASERARREDRPTGGTEARRELPKSTQAASRRAEPHQREPRTDRSEPPSAAPPVRRGDAPPAASQPPSAAPPVRRGDAPPAASQPPSAAPPVRRGDAPPAASQPPSAAPPVRAPEAKKPEAAKSKTDPRVQREPERPSEPSRRVRPSEAPASKRAPDRPNGGPPQVLSASHTMAIPWELGESVLDPVSAPVPEDPEEFEHLALQNAPVNLPEVPDLSSLSLPDVRDLLPVSGAPASSTNDQDDEEGDFAASTRMAQEGELAGNEPKPGFESPPTRRDPASPGWPAKKSDTPPKTKVEAERSRARAPAPDERPEVGVEARGMLQPLPARSDGVSDALRGMTAFGSMVADDLGSPLGLAGVGESERSERSDGIRAITQPDAKEKLDRPLPDPSSVPPLAHVGAHPAFRVESEADPVDRAESYDRIDSRVIPRDLLGPPMDETRAMPLADARPSPVVVAVEKPAPDVRHRGATTLRRSFALAVDLGLIVALLSAAAFAGVLGKAFEGGFVLDPDAITASFYDGKLFLVLAALGTACVLASTVCVGALGATPGLFVSGLRVIERTSGARPSFPRALARALLSIASFAILGLGWFWILVDLESRALHDVFTRTSTVRT